MCTSATAASDPVRVATWSELPDREPAYALATRSRRSSSRATSPRGSGRWRTWRGWPGAGSCP